MVLFINIEKYKNLKEDFESKLDPQIRIKNLKNSLRGHKLGIAKLLTALDEELYEMSLKEDNTGHIRDKMNFGRDLLDELLDVL